MKGDKRLTNREARIMLENFIYWRDIRIPAIELEFETISPSFIANYSGGVRGSGTSSPTQNEAIKHQYLVEELHRLRRTIKILNFIRGTLDDSCKELFDLFADPQNYTWDEIMAKTNLTEKEFRYRRNKILGYIRETFDGLSLPLLG